MIFCVYFANSQMRWGKNTIFVQKIQLYLCKQFNTDDFVFLQIVCTRVVVVSILFFGRRIEQNMNKTASEIKKRREKTIF